MNKSKNTETIRREVLSFLKNHGKQSFRIKEIARKLGYADNRDYRRFLEVMEGLDDEALVARQKGNRFSYRRPSGTAVGLLSVNPKGFGFVEVEGTTQDYFVSPANLGTALDGDKVKISTAARSRDGRRREAVVLEVIDRSRKQTVGTFKRHGKFGVVSPDDLRITHDIYVDGDHINGARDGQKVVVSIDRFDSPHAAPEGRVLQIIGPADDARVQVLALAMSLGVSGDFPDEVEDEAQNISQTLPDPSDRRLDLRDKRTFTIDPDDAKDFDDAIHVELLGSGMLKIGVHIADVSFFVHPDSAIDGEARERATSVYLVDRVIPMLPESLSNDLCSLRPDVDRLTFSCLMTIDRAGNVHDYTITPSIIRSKARLTYEEAQAIIDGDDHPLATDVRTANELAIRLTEERMTRGSIDFDVPEVKVRLGPDGTPTEMFVKERSQSNRLIEEFMLLANRTVAEHAASAFDQSPFVFRIHDSPDFERIRNLAHYVRAFGHRLEIKNGTVDSRELNKLLRGAEGRPEAPVIEQAALRAMAKAAYSVENIGHYGLGFDFYTHFTSPIRRYPDLMVHRLLKAYEAGEVPPDPEQLEATCRHCSEKERSAEVAERESIKLKQVEYARDHLGDSFDGVVTGVTRFGVFVEITSLLVEGMVHVRDMDDDYYEYDEATFSLIGVETGRRYQPGRVVRVTIVAANLESREIDLFFAEE